MKVINVDVSNLFSDMGMQHLENEEYEDALKYFNEGLEHESENILLLYNKAICLWDMGEGDKAEPIFNQVVEICEKTEKTEFSLSIHLSCLIALNDLDNIENVLNDLLEINPDNVDALVNYGQLYNKNMDYKKALEYFDRALEIDSQNEHALTFKADVLFSLSRYDEAKECIDKAFELSKNNPYIWYLKGQYESNVLSNYNGAVECYDKALELDAGFEKCLYDKMISLTLLGNSKEAKETFHQYVELHPDDYDAKRRAVSDEVIDMLVSAFAKE